MKAHVHPADETEAAGGQALLAGLAQVFLRLALLWVDGGYKRRWVVERTFAWLGRNRWLSKDYEALPASEEAWIHAASCRLLLRRWAR